MTDVFSERVVRMVPRGSDPWQAGEAMVDRIRAAIGGLGLVGEGGAYARAADGSQIERPTIGLAVVAADEHDLVIHAVGASMSLAHAKEGEEATYTNVNVDVIRQKSYTFEMSVGVIAPTKVTAKGIASVARDHLDRIWSRRPSSALGATGQVVIPIVRGRGKRVGRLSVLAVVWLVRAVIAAAISFGLGTVFSGWLKIWVGH